MESLWTKDVVQVPAEDLREFSLNRKTPVYSVYSGEQSSSGLRVGMKVLTVESSDAGRRFVQEAALLKILQHRSISSFIGVATLPPGFLRGKESSNASLPVIITEHNEGISLASFVQSLESRRGLRRRKYPYNEILDVLIDVADALQYLHTRHPAVIHRGISMTSVTVIRTEQGLRGGLDTLYTALLTAEASRRVKKLGEEVLLEGALNSEDLLSLDFFKEPASCTASNPTSPRRAPQLPLLTSSIVDKHLKKSKKPLKSIAPIYLKDKAPKKPDPMNKSTVPRPRRVSLNLRSAKNSSVAPAVKVIAQVSAHAVEKLDLVETPVLRPLEIMDVVLEEDENSENSSREAEDQVAEGAVKRRTGPIFDSPSAFPPSSAASPDRRSPGNDFKLAAKTKEYDSASSSRSHDQTTRLKAEQMMTELTQKSPCSDIIPAGKQPVQLIDTDPCWSALSTSVTEDEINRSDSISHLKEDLGEMNLAPEILKGESYSTSSDVFSFGIVLYTALTRKTPTRLPDPGHLDFVFPERFPDDVQSLIIDCCDPKPQTRPKMRAVYDRLRLIKESGCLNSMKQKKRRRFSCFGRPV